MKSAEDIRNLVKNAAIDSNPAVNSAVLEGLLEELDTCDSTDSVAAQPDLRRKIMKSRITKLAAAAAVIVAVVLPITFLDKAITPAYALEQTIKANHSLLCFHFKMFKPSHDSVAKESWIEHDKRGQVKNIRVNFAEWWNNGQIIAWKEGKTQVWNRKKNILDCFEDEIYTDKMLVFAQRYNPKGAVEYLYELQTQGKVNIEIDESFDKSDQVIVTATYLPNTYLLEGAMPAMREVVFIDKDSKLVSTIKVYEFKKGIFEYMGSYEYDKNKNSFDADIFNLDKEIPENVKRIDLMSQDIGLEQEELSESAIAVKVVREFLDALIVKDYAKAGKLHGIESPNDAKEKLENLKVVRIVSIGQPALHGRPASIRVPYTIEIQQKEGVNIQKSGGFLVHRVYGQPNRWQIIGGTN
jgi:hypothetical protein